VQDPSLKDKQEAFVLAYLGEARFNASKAARLAGYSDAAAGQAGYQLLKNSHIRARIDKHLEAMTMGAAEVLAELTDVASAEWRDFLTIKRDKDGEIVDVRMDLTAKIKSLELLGKNYKLFTDSLNLSGDITSSVRLVGISEEDV
jgi:phage terminase small subunit